MDIRDKTLEIECIYFDMDGGFGGFQKRPKGDSEDRGGGPGE